MNAIRAAGDDDRFVAAHSSVAVKAIHVAGSGYRFVARHGAAP